MLPPKGCEQAGSQRDAPSYGRGVWCIAARCTRGIWELDRAEQGKGPRGRVGQA